MCLIKIITKKKEEYEIYAAGVYEGRRKTV